MHGIGGHLNCPPSGCLLCGKGPCRADLVHPLKSCEAGALPLSCKSDPTRWWPGLHCSPCPGLTPDFLEGQARPAPLFSAPRAIQGAGRAGALCCVGPARPVGSGAAAADSRSEPRCPGSEPQSTSPRPVFFIRMVASRFAAGHSPSISLHSFSCITNAICSFMVTMQMKAAYFLKINNILLPTPKQSGTVTRYIRPLALRRVTSLCKAQFLRP